MAMEKGEERENVARWTPNDEPTESSTEKLIRKSKKEPFIPIGFAGLIGAVAYGIYGYRNRGPMSTSRYLMRLRVIAQSCVVGAIIIGVGFAAVKDNSAESRKR